MKVLLLLLLAHLLGDFLLQPKKWVRDKELRAWRSPYLYLHILVHILLLFLFLSFKPVYSMSIVGLGLSHLLIDGVKAQLNHRVNIRLLFIGDQLLHLFAIILFLWFYNPELFTWNSEQQGLIIVMAIAVLLVTVVASVIMNVLISKWRFVEKDSRDSLKDAGKYIGMLERLLILCFVMFLRWEAVGFLIAAKSVFRFSDLSRAKDRKLTEYILIGTLLSICIAIATALAARMMLTYLGLLH